MRPPGDAPILASDRLHSAARDRRHRRGNPDRNSWHLTLPRTTTEHRATPFDVGGVQICFTGKGTDQLLVGGHVVEHSDQKARFTCNSANLGRPDARDGQKPAKPFAVPGNEGESLDRKSFGLFPREIGAARHWSGLSVAVSGHANKYIGHRTGARPDAVFQRFLTAGGSSASIEARGSPGALALGPIRLAFALSQKSVRRSTEQGDRDVL